MRHLKKPASGSYCGPDAPLRFILGVLIMVALLAAASLVLDGQPLGG